MDMDKALEQVRNSAHGIERNLELESQFPIRERYEINVPNGEETVHVFVCEPLNREGVTPLIINMHGGGFVKGYRGRDYVLSANLACSTGCLVADVDYIPAPEQKFPFAVFQGYAVVKYFYENHEKYRIDPKKIILSGQSAGANMITALTLYNKERGGEDFHVRQLILAYPPLDLLADPLSKPFNDDPKNREISERAILYNSWYATEEDRHDYHASLTEATAEQLRGLPPVLVMTGGLDSLGAEGELFAYHLIRAGVEVHAKRMMNSKHGFLVRREGDYQEAEKLIFETVKKIREE